MPLGNEVAVVGFGLATPLGVGWPQTATAVRASVSAFRELTWDEARFPPTVMAALPDEVLLGGGSPLTSGADISAGEMESRLARLALLALQTLGENAAGRPVPLMIGLPDPRELDGYQPDRVMEQLCATAGRRVARGAGQVICKGRAAGLLAVAEAASVLRSGGADLVLAGGCDSYRSMARIEALDEAGRLNTDQNMDGFVPGEGAGFLLMTTLVRARELGIRPFCVIGGSAAGFETGHLGSEEPYLGEGLCSAWQGLLQPAAPRHIRAVYSSMNGEHHWARELGTACIRCKDQLADDVTVEHPADCLGDLGAASGPVLVAQAAWAMNRGHLAGPALVYGSSDLGERAVLLVGATPA